MPRTSRSSKRRQLDSNSEDDFIDDGPSTSKEKPKKSSKKRTTETTKNNSDSEDEQGEKRLHGFTPAEITQLSHNIAKYVLNNSISKFPIKRADVVKNVLNGK